jgi:hypothetical protein
VLYAAVFCALAPMAVAAEDTFVGRDVCASCHQAEAALWQGSDHDKAMQEATEATVLGDFDNTSLTHFGVTSTFSHKDGAFPIDNLELIAIGKSAGLQLRRSNSIFQRLGLRRLVGMYGNQRTVSFIPDLNLSHNR